MPRKVAKFKHWTKKQLSMIPPILEISKQDEENGQKYAYQKIKEFYKGCLELEEEYKRDEKAFRAKAATDKLIMGDHKGQYSMIRGYVQELITLNPGTTVKCQVEMPEDHNTFFDLTRLHYVSNETEQSFTYLTKTYDSFPALRMLVDGRLMGTTLNLDVQCHLINDPHGCAEDEFEKLNCRKDYYLTSNKYYNSIYVDEYRSMYMMKAIT
ncbi:lectin protein kinase family protein [Artemisia annua]|uniref:Lectin protein kinase family protein n=1 Tax=Artemisia annua TaxID=35608 RepID=A0A2U1MG31_ARTAN|nr:lectin protein kinase family protein [Artemisia annua]